MKIRNPFLIIPISVILVVIIFFGILLNERNNKNLYSAVSYVKVLSKEEANGEYWVVALMNPYNNETKPKQIKLILDSKNTWNLVQENTIYLAGYDYYSLDDGAKLVNIQLPN